MGKNSYYITTTLPYVNANPHMGHALELVQADCLARYRRLQGGNVFFSTGTDEHGLKIYEKAKEAGVDTKTYVDTNAQRFDKLKTAFNLTYNAFIRTTDPQHMRATQEFWKRCMDRGDIYKAKQDIKYCVGCEMEKTESELIEEKCPIHPTKKIEVLREENYFFRFSAYEKALLELYRKRDFFVIPDKRLNEIRAFVSSGLRDFSISRLREKLPWGVPVPNDEEHVMYVWFDALINYISTLGWPDDMDTFMKWWPAVQVAGKDNLRQQAAMWQAMLMSAGIEPSEQIFIHGFITSEGEKMSKTTGNVVDPFALVEEYGVDAMRYYLLGELPSYTDGDYSRSRFIQVYNADLANGLGNTVSRLSRLAQNLEIRVSGTVGEYRFFREVGDFMKAYRFDSACKRIWEDLRRLEQYLDENEPWKKDREEAIEIVRIAIEGSPQTVSIREIALALSPFLPSTADYIKDLFKGPFISAKPPLFARIKVNVDR